MVHAVANSVVPKFTVIIGGSFGAGNYGMCGRAYEPRLLWMWPNARISVMGGEQARVGADHGQARPVDARGQAVHRQEEKSAIRQPILDKYEHEGSPYSLHRAPVGRWRDRAGADAADARARAVGGVQRTDPAAEVRRVPNVEHNATTKTHEGPEGHTRKCTCVAMTYTPVLGSAKRRSNTSTPESAPDVRNAFNEHVIAELTGVGGRRLMTAAARREIRAIVDRRRRQECSARGPT